MFNRKPKTLKQALVHALITPVMVTGGLGAGLAVGSLAPTQMEMSPHPDVPSQAQTPAEGSPGDLITKHDCWTGEAPADMQGKFPGHVVVTKGGAVAPVYGGQALVGKSLEQIFDGVDHNLTVHGFCR